MTRPVDDLGENAPAAVGGEEVTDARWRIMRRVLQWKLGQIRKVVDEADLSDPAQRRQVFGALNRLLHRLYEDFATPEDEKH